MCEQVQRPANDPYIGKAALQRDLSQIAGLTRVPADYRVGPHHNHESTRKPGPSRVLLFAASS